VYLAGGEPLLMKENLILLEKLDSNTNIRINTNLSKVDTQVFDAVCGFKNVHWTVSVETQAEEFEYIRHGGIWLDFLDNLAIIKQLGHKISFNMLHFLLNYNSVFDCVDFLKAQGFHNNSFVIGALLTPEYLNIRHLPKNVLNSVKNKLQHRINQKPGYLLEDSYQNMLHYIDKPFEKNISLSIDKLAELDQRRGINSRNIFTDFYKDIDHGKTI
jgi:molybdenum cofactor biosynthesis enzyme MoaA